MCFVSVQALHQSFHALHDNALSLANGIRQSGLVKVLINFPDFAGYALIGSINDQVQVIDTGEFVKFFRWGQNLVDPQIPIFSST